MPSRTSRPSALRALIVAIERYGTIADASGAVADAAAWRDLLVGTYGASPESIRVVTNQRATKKSVLERVDWLFHGPARDHLLVFAGHGMVYRARHPDGRLASRSEEVLLCHGYGAHGEDDDASLLRYTDIVKAGTSRLTVIIDACYSGAFRSPRPRRVGPLARTFEQPLDYAHRILGADVARFGGSVAAPQARSAASLPLVIAASGPQEESYADRVPGGSARRGLFSYFATDTWIKAPETTPERMVGRVRRQIDAFLRRAYGPGYRQRPQLSGPRGDRRGLVPNR